MDQTSPPSTLISGHGLWPVPVALEEDAKTPGVDTP